MGWFQITLALLIGWGLGYVSEKIDRLMKQRGLRAIDVADGMILTFIGNKEQAANKLKTPPEQREDGEKVRDIQ